MSERGKYDALVLIIYRSLCCVPCPAYDPLGALFDVEESHFIDIRSPHAGRVIPLRISFSKKKGPLPVILFSHGLGGSRNGYKYVRASWTARGYATIFFNIQVVTNRSFKARLLVKPYANSVTLPPERI